MDVGTPHGCYPVRQEGGVDKQTFLKGVGEVMRRARGRMSVTIAAQLAGVSRDTIYRVERGEIEPGFYTIARIADAYTLSLDRLAGRSIIDYTRTDKFSMAPADIQRRLLPLAEQLTPKRHGRYNTRQQAVVALLPALRKFLANIDADD